MGKPTVSMLGNNEQADETYTPKDSVKHLLPFINKKLTWYEATSGKSTAIVDSLTDLGVSIFGSNGRDFFECTSFDVFDGIITNPPYSKKDKFIEHAYNLGKPFAFLLPVAAFQGKARGKLFKKYGISALVYNSRVDFTGKKSPPFGVAWFMVMGS